MSRPSINPDKTVAGIALDPQTLDRVIPESRRPDGTVRKQIKIRPGYTPQEDVHRFRGTKQAQMDANTLPKGHIIGWAPPPTSATASSPNGTKPLSKSAKKNAKRKEKREKEKEDTVPENWDEDDEPNPATATSGVMDDSGVEKIAMKSSEPKPDSKKEPASETSTEALTRNLETLDVK